MMASPHIAVVGGGFVGAACALHLLARGFKVTLVEASARCGGAAAASYGNAGTFANYACRPVNNPGLLTKLPLALVHPRSPVSVAPLGAEVIKWGSDPLTWRWLSLFARHCSEENVAYTTNELAVLLHQAEEGWKVPLASLTSDERATLGEHWVGAEPTEGRLATPEAARTGCMYLFDTEAAASADLAVREGVGVRGRVLSRAEMTAKEPALRDTDRTAVMYESAWSLASPGSLCAALNAAVARAPNGRLLTGRRVERLVDSAGAHVQLLDSDGTDVLAGEAVTHVVVAAGARSGALARSVGDDIPIDTERGYHIVMEAPEADAAPLLSRPVGGSGLYMSPMRHNDKNVVRVAGLVEMGGLDAPPTAKRFDQLESTVRELLPAIAPYKRVDEWLGYVEQARCCSCYHYWYTNSPRLSRFRPTAPDALPYVGWSRRAPRVLYAFGHQHVGWTLGGITGAQVADLVGGGGGASGEAGPLDPHRFD